MSTTIDERVVEMRFDNKQFESNVQTSLSTLDKLKQSLDLNGAAKGLENINDAAKKCDMSKLSGAIETVQARFSALEIMAMTTLANITNSAVNAGKRLISAFTIDPIKTGFDEYELKMGSIQTIMASTGESLDVVNKKLDELNTYSDKTIYSFSDMTSNIGKFTNAGVKLDDAVKAIQGVSNEAAVSGANANEASRAMYNFAQALSAGYVKLIDWKSIENANMATVEFKNQLLESAVAAGTLTKTTDGMYRTLKGNVLDATHNFNDTLQDQWMTSEALIETLKDYADETTEIGKKAFAAAQDVKTFSQLLDTLKESAQSGWAETWQLIVGDYEEAKGTLREFSEFFSNIIDSSSEARNSMLVGALTSSWGQLKSRVSEAGISVDDFRTALRETAVDSIDGFDEMVEKAGSFDATLSEGWLTTDILSKALDNLANKATGTTGGIAALTDEQLKNIGYTEEQITALRTLGDQAGAVSGPIADLVKNMTRKSGRELLFDSVLNACKALQKVFGTLKGAWDDIFPAASAERLYGIISAINEFSKKLIISDETADKVRRTFKGLFAILDIVKQAFTPVLSALKPLIGGLGSFGDGVLSVTAALGDWIVGIDETLKKNDVFNKAVQKVTGFIQGAVAAIGEFASAIQEKFNIPSLDEAKESVKGFLQSIQAKIGAPGLELVHALLEKIKERLDQVREAMSRFKEGVLSSFDEMGSGASGSKFLQIMQTLWNGVKTIGGGAVSALSTLISALANAISNADFSGLIDFVNALSFGGIALALKKFTEPLEAIGGIKDSVVGILTSVRGCFEAYQTQLQAGTLLKIAAAIAILTASIIALSIIDSEKLNVAIGAITMLFAELMASMAVFNKISGTAAKGLVKTSAAMLLVSTSVFILASALRKMADLEWEDIAQGLVGIAGLSAIIVASAKALSSGGGSVIKGAAGLVVFAAAIKILASACEDLSGLDWGELAIGLTGVGVLFAEIAAFLKVAKFDGKAISTAAGIVILSAAIKILATACADFGEMDTGSLVQGLTSVGVLLLALGAFTKIAGGSKNMVSIGTGLVIIAASMKIFASAVGDFGGMDIPTLAKGLTAMGIALAEITVAMRLMPKNMIGIGAGLVVVGAALEIVANVLGKLGSMNPGEIAKSLIAMGVAFAELAIALNLMTGTLAGSAALLVASVALLALVPALKILGGMSWESIVKGLVALGGAFAVIGIAGAVLTPLVPTILGLGAALALIGVGVVAAAAGISLLAAGITALAVALAGGAVSIVAGLTVIVTGVASLIPAVVAKIGEAIVEFCKVIANGAPAIGEAVKAVILTLVDVLVECVPAIAKGALELLTGVMEALSTYTPRIVDALFQFLIGVLDGIAKNLPTLIQAAMNVFMAFFSGIVDALAGIDTSVLLKGIAGVGLLAAMMTALSAVAALVPAAMIGILGMGVIIGELALVLAAVGALAQLPGLNWLINEGGKLLQGIGTAIGGFVGGIVGGFMSGVSSQFPQIGLDLAAFMTNIQPFVEGASNITPELMSGVKALTEVILLLTAADILNGLTSWLTGGASLSDFADQLVPFGEAMMGFSNAIAGMDGNLVSNAAIAGKTLAEMAATIPNSGGIVGFFAGENDMEAFGEQLIGFGDAMVGFADTVSGLDSEVVVNAATAGKAMAEMAATLPNSGGVSAFFAGENDMDAFGEQLIPFGRAIKSFSDEVAGLDVAAIQNSATAGQAMVELARTLPNSGGVVSFFTGENDIDAFGLQLISFGNSIKAYSMSVAGMDVDAVVNSATAGQALVELAKTLPNCGGLVSVFTGDNSIAAFGDDLVLFGYDLAAYSAAISTVQPDAVAASANAASALSNLAAGLPDSSLFDKWFGGDQTLADFGDDIAAFGEDMGYYYSQIAGADPAKLSGVIDQVWRLAELAEGTQNLDLSGFSNFSNSLEAMASVGIDGFTAAFYNSNERINSAISSMLGMVTGAISANMPNTTSSMRVLVDGLIGAVNEKTPDMNQAASVMILGISATIRTDGEVVKLTVVTILTQTLNIINSRRGDFTDAGKNVSQGFIDGIRANIQAAANVAAEMAQAALTAAQKRLDINSPSGEFKALGMYVDLGLAKGITENAYTATNAATSMGSAIVLAFKKRLEINSPSRVTKDEVGRYIVQGIAEGITADMSAEDAATKKAQNIVSAFKAELDKFSLDSSTADLEYQLWEKLNPNASASEKASANMSLLSNKFQLQTEKVHLAQAEYQTTLDTLGAASEETQQAYNKLLQEQIDLADLGSQLTQARQTETERNREAFSAYADYMNEHADSLLKFGFTMDEIQAAARERSGWDPDGLLKGLDFDVEEAVTNAMGTVQVAYQQGAETTLSELTASSTEMGAGMATAIGTAIGTGLQNGAPAAVQSGATAMVASCSEAIQSQSQTWSDAGGVLVDSFITGIQANQEKLSAVIVTFVQTGSNEIVGQKQLWVDAACTLVDGFIEGIRSNVERAAQEAAAMAIAAYQAAMSAIGSTTTVVSGASSGVSSYASASTSGGSSSSRVIDLDDAVSQVRATGAIVGAALNMTPLGTITRVATTAAVLAANKVSNSEKAESGESTSSTNYNFTQNNYSPTALDRTTIYRNTKNQFSQLKGR